MEKSEVLSGMLKKKGINHTVLNAKYHAREAEIHDRDVAGLLLDGHVGDAGSVSPDDVRGAVCRRVVDHQHLDGRNVLRQHAVNRLDDVILAVVNRDDDADQRPVATPRRRQYTYGLRSHLLERLYYPPVLNNS